MQNENENVEKRKTWLEQVFKNSQVVVGIGAAIGIVVITVIVAALTGKGEEIETFAHRWEAAVESKDSKKYQNLWDPVALRTSKEAQQQYNEAVKRTRPYGKIVAQVKPLSHRKDPRSKDLYRIESIPVELFKDGQLLMRTYRGLVVKRKGVRKRWYLVRDQELRDQQEFPQSSQEVIASTEGTDPPETEPTVTINEAASGLSGNTPVDTQLKIRQVLGAWQRSWQTKDLQTYMAQYADEAKITRVTVVDGKEDQDKKRILNKAQLRQGMVRLNKRYSKIEVLISNLQINGDTAVADVGFLQTYKAFTPASGNRPAYRDFGTKTLILAIDAKDGIWKIYKESWKNYKDVPNYPKL